MSCFFLLCYVTELFRLHIFYDTIKQLIGDKLPYLKQCSADCALTPLSETLENSERQIVLKWFKNHVTQSMPSVAVLEHKVASLA